MTEPTGADEPRLVSWSPWGRREDHIELSSLWGDAKRLAAAHGLVATAYERQHGPHARVHQFALNYVIQASLDFYLRTFEAIGVREALRFPQGDSFVVGLFIYRELKVRDILRLEGPMGTFFLREEGEKPMVMVASGTGFAPI